MIANLIATMLYVPLAQLFMYELNYGIVGLAYANVTKSIVLVLSVVLYGRYSAQIRDVLQPFNAECFRGWGAYLRISIPTTVMICSEWWAFECMTIMAGMMGVVPLASQTIYINISATLFMVPCGI